MPIAQGQPSLESQTKAASAIMALQQSLADLIEKVEPAVVAIHRKGGAVRPAGQGSPPSSLFKDHPFPFQPARDAPGPFQPVGSGVVIDSTGLILTQYLNIRVGDRHTVTTTDGRVLPAKIKAADPRSGLAVLEIVTSGQEPLKWRALELGDADQLRKGHFVVALSNPLAIAAEGEPTASWGIVSNFAQKASPSTNFNNVTDDLDASFHTTLHHLGMLLQTDARLGWSTGGGALVDLEGKLIGVTTTAGTLPGHESGAGYAIPMTRTFRRVVSELKEGREVEYGLLGLQPSDATTDDSLRPPRPKGATVASLVEGGAARQAGIRLGDLLTDVDGEPIRAALDVHRLIGSMPPGQRVTIGLLRKDRRQELEVTLSKRHVQGSQVATNVPPAWRGIETDYATALPPAELMMASQAGLLDAKGCVVVRRVVKKSPAWQAGVRPGMFISHVGKKRVSTPEQFRKAVLGTTETMDLQFTDLQFTDQASQKEKEAK